MRQQRALDKDDLLVLLDAIRAVEQVHDQLVSEGLAVRELVLETEDATKFGRVRWNEQTDRWAFFHD